MFSMSMIRLSILLLPFISIACYAQQVSELDLKMLSSWSEIILKSPDDTEKEEANRLFTNKLLDLLQEPASFSYPFKELSFIAILQSADKKVRIFNWHIPYTDGTYAYSAIVTRNVKDAYTVKKLTEISKQGVKDLTKTLKANEWIGAHYYDIIDMPQKNKTYYILLGWDGYNLLANRKILEVLHFDADNTLLLGADIFKTKEKPQKRYIYTYADEAMMTMRYERKKRAIVFNNLAPLSSNLKNVEAYYVPDGAFNAFVWKKDKWEFVQDYDARLDKNLKDQFYKVEETPKLEDNNRK